MLCNLLEHLGDRHSSAQHFDLVARFEAGLVLADKACEPAASVIGIFQKAAGSFYIIAIKAPQDTPYIHLPGAGGSASILFAPQAEIAPLSESFLRIGRRWSAEVPNIPAVLEIAAFR